MEFFLLSLWMCAHLLQLGHATIYTNDWAIRIRGDVESVDKIAHKYGFTNMGQVCVGPTQTSSRHCLQVCIIDL